MSKFVQAYDSYGDFNRTLFFIIQFDILPSNLELKVPLKDSKENMLEVLNNIDFDSFSLHPVLTSWNTKDHNNSHITEDYPHEYLYKSSTDKLAIWISLEGNELYMEFLYDIQNKEIEKWIVETNHKLRVKYGKPKTPIFRVLSRNDRSFFTEKVSTHNFKQIDIHTLYNDDFLEINDIILKAIEDNKSGLILLHGQPGTGKTSYIKNLISNFASKRFIFVQNEFVQELLKPEFISFLLKNKDSILIIEDAEKIIMSRESSESSVVSTILQLTDGLFSDYLNIKVLCTFNSKINNIDKALFRKGRMIANYEFKALSEDKTKKLLNQLGHHPVETEMTLSEVFGMKEKNFLEEEKKGIGFH